MQQSQGMMVTPEADMELCSCSFGRNCGRLPTIAKESEVLTRPPNKSQENFPEAQDLNKRPAP